MIAAGLVLLVVRHIRVEQALDQLERVGGVYGDIAYPLVGPSHYVCVGGWGTPDVRDLRLTDDKLIEFLPALGRFWFLSRISVSRCPNVTSRGAIELVRTQPRVPEWIFSQTSVDDELLLELTQGYPIELLAVDDTQVSPAGLRQLANCKSLRYLSVRGIPMTEAEFGELCALLPHAEVKRRIPQPDVL
jgi:hypothetical protein